MKRLPFLVLLLVPLLEARPKENLWAETLRNLAAGGTLVIPSGDYRDQVLVVNRGGTAENPTRIRSARGGTVTFQGASALVIQASHVRVEGFVFSNGGIPEGMNHVVEVRGDGVTLEDCAIESYNQGGRGKQWIILFGSSNRVSRCFFAGKTTVDPTLQIEVERERPSGAIIEACHFGPRPPLGQNGGETIRIGYSKQAWFDGSCVVRKNLFEACDGELEVISGKCMNNRYLSNTFLRCAGALTLRHGNGSLVRGNVFLGEGKAGTAGIRVIGADHRLIDNHFEGLTKDLGAISLTAAQEPFADNGYWTVTNIRIEGNTMAGGSAPGVHFSAMAGGKNGSQTVLPKDCLFVSNTWDGSGPAYTGTVGAGHRFIGERVRPSPEPVLPGVTVLSTPPSTAGRPAGYGPLQILTPRDVGPSWRGRP